MIRDRKIVATYKDQSDDKVKVFHRDRHNNKTCKARPAHILFNLTNAVSTLVGRAISIERKRQGLTRNEFGQACGFVRGSSKLMGSYVDQIENVDKYGRGGFHLGTLYAAAIVLDVAPEKLLPNVNDVISLSKVGAKRKLNGRNTKFLTAASENIASLEVCTNHDGTWCIVRGNEMVADGFDSEKSAYMKLIELEKKEA